MSDYSKTNVTIGGNVGSDVNTQLGEIETAVNSKGDKSGFTMTGDLDMNSNQVLNLLDAATGSEPVTLRQLQAFGKSNTADPDGTFRSYDTMASAQADVSDLTIGDVVFLEERSANNGGASFWKVVDATTVTENEFDIVTGDATRSLQILSANNLSVQAFGVVSDGSTDDTAALKRALEFSSENKIKVQGVKGSGDCVITGISITSKPDVHLEGNIVIRGSDNTQTSLIAFTSSDNVHIKGIELDCGITNRGDTWGASYIQRCLSFTTCNNLRIENCKASDGYLINPSPAAPGVGPLSDEVLIAVLVYTSSCNNVHIVGNQPDGVDLTSLNSTDTVSIKDNQCGNDTSNGGVTTIFQSACSNITASGNDIQYVNITGRGGFFFGVNGSRFTISDNTGYKIAGNNNGHAVYAQEMSDVTITGNTWIENGDLSIRDCNDVVVDGNNIDATDDSNGTIYSIRFEGVSAGANRGKITNNSINGVSGLITGGTAAVQDVHMSGNDFYLSRSNYVKYQSGSTSLTNLEVRDNKVISSIAISTSAEPFVDFEGQAVSGTVRVIDNTHIRTNGYSTQASVGESFELGLGAVPVNYELRGNGNRYIKKTTDPVLEDGLIGAVTYTEVIGTVNDPDTSTPVASALQRLDDLTATVAIGGETYKIEGASIDFTNGLLSTGGIPNLQIDVGGGITVTTQTTFAGLQLLRFTRDGTYPKVALAVDTSYASPRSRLKAGDGIQMQELTAAPSDIVDGLIIYADGTSYNPGSGEGFYGRENGAWVKL